MTPSEPGLRVLEGSQGRGGRAGAANIRRWALGDQVPNDRRGLAAGLGERHAVRRLPAGHQARDLYDG
ncbi:hypothetical protein G6F65_022209 [Rhizopus arrhizus]|nr:hypothetical protein G6F65_022209 [Rhizopus arrhizus]